MDEPVVVTTADRVAEVTIDRPAALNALNAAVLERLLGAVEGLSRERAIGAIVLSGAGGRAVGPRADVRELARAPPAAAGPIPPGAQAPAHPLRPRPPPVPPPVDARFP